MEKRCRVPRPSTEGLEDNGFDVLGVNLIVLAVSVILLFLRFLGGKQWRRTIAWFVWVGVAYRDVGDDTVVVLIKD
jgi:hypothetical protein